MGGNGDASTPGRCRSGKRCRSESQTTRIFRVSVNSAATQAESFRYLCTGSILGHARISKWNLLSEHSHRCRRAALQRPRMTCMPFQRGPAAPAAGLQIIRGPCQADPSTRSVGEGDCDGRTIPAAANERPRAARMIRDARLTRCALLGRAQSPDPKSRPKGPTDWARPAVAVDIFLPTTPRPPACRSYGRARRSAMRSVRWGAQRKPIPSKANFSVQRARSSCRSSYKAADASSARSAFIMR